MNTILIVTKKLINVGISLYIGNLIGRDVGKRLDRAKVAIETKISKSKEETVH